MLLLGRDFEENQFTLAVIPHTSHWVMLDAPQWFHTELVHFLGRCRHSA